MITVCYNYYNNRELFEEVKAFWAKVEYKHLLFVDDGSQDEPLTAGDMLEGWQLYRINEDLPFAYNLARNTAMRNTESGWNLLLDLDHIPNDKLVKRMNSYSFKRKHLTLVHRIKFVTAQYKQHTSQFFVHKDDYWSVGGYQEVTTGYGNDHEFRTKFRTFHGTDYREMPKQFQLHEIRQDASPGWLNEKKRHIRKVPNPGYTVTRLA